MKGDLSPFKRAIARDKSEFTQPNIYPSVSHTICVATAKTAMVTKMYSAFTVEA